MREDLPNQIEKDDEKFHALMDCQDPDGIAGFEEDVPLTLEEKYERQIMMEKVIQPMFDKLFETQEKGLSDEE